MIKTFFEFINEASSQTNIITDKDWERMLDLILTKDTSGSKVASSIKDKKKAIARFVCGIKLKNSKLDYDTRLSKYSGYYSDLGNKALSLGATADEIQTIFDSTTVPAKFSQKIDSSANKKLSDRFVGSISKSILDAGFDIEWTKSGNALTGLGKDAMSRNGRKWTIGYKSVITIGDKKINLSFDAITDEGDGPTSYVLDSNGSDNIFKHSWRLIGKREFTQAILDALNKIK